MHRKTLLVLCLILMGLGLLYAGTLRADSGPSLVVRISQGNSTFMVRGESFSIQAPRSLVLRFSTVSSTRVAGLICLDTPDCPDSVVLVWNPGGDPETILFQGPITGDQAPFDSGPITGHNEK